MRTQTLKHLLTLSTLLLLAGATAVVLTGVALPIDVPDIRDKSDTQPIVEPPRVETRHVPDPEALRRLARLDLRQRLFDPPPQPKPVATPKPPPSIRLMGTIVNASNSQAMIAGAGGQVELKRVGDTVGETNNTAVIKEIFSDHIKVEHDGRVLDITILEDAGRAR